MHNKIPDLTPRTPNIKGCKIGGINSLERVRMGDGGRGHKGIGVSRHERIGDSKWSSAVTAVELILPAVRDDFNCSPKLPFRVPSRTLTCLVYFTSYTPYFPDSLFYLNILSSASICISIFFFYSRAKPYIGKWKYFCNYFAC